ncbi:MAG: glycosyltransferase [Patescibacteria group bacterium]
MKIALAHDYLNQYGGAERVLQVLCRMFPHAPIYTMLYDENATRGAFRDRIVHTTFLQHIPLARRYHHAFSFLMPLAVEQLDTSAFDVVLSVSSSFAKGIITKPSTRHICYCLTPPRYLWDDSHKYIQEFRYPNIVKKIIPPFLSYMRVWDRQASMRPDDIIAISDFVRQRISKYYRRDASVLHPPVDTKRFIIADSPLLWRDDYFLMVGRLVSYKKFDMAVRACNHLRLPLKIVGTGIEHERLRALAGPTVEFIGQVDDARLAELYQRARAVIFPQEEDFGIVPLEAMACGTPVIAYRGGGALETVIEGVTGIFFDEQTDESLVAALNNFEKRVFDPQLCREQAEKFNMQAFETHMRAILTNYDHRR